MDFSQNFSKENVCIYMNCQGNGIKYFLDKLNLFNITHLENYKFIYEKRDIPINLLKNTKIFIYQPIKSKNGIYSTDNNINGSIVSFLPESCIKISIPYIYNSALWCLYCDTGKYYGEGEIIKLINEKIPFSFLYLPR